MLSGYIKSTVIVLLVVANNAMAQESGWHRAPKITFFVNLNQTYPINNIQKAGQVVYPHNLLASRSMFPSGFNTGVTLFFFKRLGFDLAISTYNFSSDSAKALSVVKDAFPSGRCGVFISEGFHVSTFSTGLSYRMEYKGFGVQPKLLIGYGEISSPQYFDIYLSQNDNPTQTYEYQGKFTRSLIFTPSMNLSYTFRLSSHVAMGFQFTCDYVYSKPEFEYSFRSYDYTNKTISSGDKTVKSGFDFWSVQGGIFFRIVHNH
jgi:hypothetical protein